MTTPAARDRAVANYCEEFNEEPSLVVRAPGRVNLIGEHTDYNEGFVLPTALPFEVVIAGAVRTDDRVVASSEGFAAIEFALHDEIGERGWQTYVHGTAHMLLSSGFSASGWQACLASDIPAGASLSSSAALEVASGLAFVTSAGSSITPTELAQVGQRVENEVLGLPSGIMDQLASAASVEGAASLIDCRDLSIANVPLPDGVDIVIMDTGTRRELVDSEYAARRTDCESAARTLGVRALRDATLDQLAQLDDERVQRRARHIITENQRTIDAATAMRSGDAVALGRLMNASHTSLRDDYSVSSPALDRMVDMAQQVDGCLGARMTGGGFAGAAVALVRTEQTPAFIADLSDNFAAPAEQPSTKPVALYSARPAAGASVLVSPNSPFTT